MKQRHTRVARALVKDAAELVGWDGHLTVPWIVRYYGLRWGRYSNGADRAEQIVRNALNNAVEDGLLDRRGRDGHWIVYGRHI